MQDTVDSTEAIRRWDLHARAILVGHLTRWRAIEHRIILLNPTLFQLLPDVNGKRVLDAGCGEGI